MQRRTALGHSAVGNASPPTGRPRGLICRRNARAGAVPEDTPVTLRHAPGGTSGEAAAKQQCDHRHGAAAAASEITASALRLQPHPSGALCKRVQRPSPHPIGIPHFLLLRL
ncbi:uncharacterized protein Tco025E_00644, partial [Trypanosoma conorhini]